MSPHSKSHLGFTLIELLVTITIVTVILTIVVLNQSTYTDTAALSNLADEIGLTVSQAQAYGIGVKEFTPGSSEFNSAYGLTFSLLSTGSNKAYLSFADRDGNHIYSGDWSCPIGGASECLARSDISRGNYINALCIVRTSGADLCDVGRIDIVFVRPSTEAQIVFFNTSGQQYSPADIKGARITLKSPRGSTRSVIVYQTGQISVQ